MNDVDVCSDCAAGTCYHTGRPWREAGTPPGRHRRPPDWAIVLIVVGAALVGVCLLFNVVSAVVGFSEGAPTSPAVDPTYRHLEVEVSGQCEKRIVGSYGLLATITVDNVTEQEVSGTVWVSWDVLGDDPQEFSGAVTAAPGEAVEFHVDEEISSEHWLRVEDCQYGFIPDGAG